MPMPIPKNPVTVVARIHAKPGMEYETRKALEVLLDPTRAEAGCINYDMHSSVDDPTQFMFYENWTSKEALDQHLTTPHLKAFMEQTSRLLTQPVEITLWKKSD